MALAKTGWVSFILGDSTVRLHRPLPDGFVLKNILLTKKADGWYCTIALDDPTVTTFNSNDVVATWNNSMGLDAVLHENDYLATSEGEKLPSLKSFRRSQAKLAKVSQRKAIKKKCCVQRRKLAKREGKVHQKIARARKDHAFQTAHALIKSDKKVFFVEDLNLSCKWASGKIRIKQILE